MSLRTRPTAGDIVKFKTEKAAKHWWHEVHEHFLIEEGSRSGGYSLLGHKEFSNEGSGFAWVSADDLNIVEYVSDRTLKLLDEAMDYEEPDEDDDE